MTAIATVLEEAGFQTFLPHRDGLEAYILRCARAALPSVLSGLRARIDYATFALDVCELIERCSAVVCNLNGRVPDEGMIVEATLAYAAGKPLVFFKDDVRAPFAGYDNSMLTSLVRGKLVGKLRELPSAIEHEMSQQRQVVPLSSDLRKAIAYGERISSALKRLPEQLGKERWSEEVLSQVLAEARKEE